MRNTVLIERTPILLILAGSSLALLGAFFFEFLGELKPCSLCLYQRVPHALAIILCMVALVFYSNRNIIGPVFGILTLTILSGVAIAGFHVGVEQKFWVGTPECGGKLEGASIEAIRMKLLQEPIVRCDEVSWSVFGISMAGYNLLLSVILAVVSFFASYSIIFKRRRL